ncbi:MAG: protein kinase [Polyangiaceae bacterium]|nr:protein kinase [Polyangiaceae bacterium]
MLHALLASRFTVVELAGKGASGEVYRAIDEHTGRSVAVKVLGSPMDAAAVDRFSREVQLLASVDDPHVVRYVAHGSDETGRPYMVVEWLEGEDLSRRQKREPLDGRQALEVVRQAAMGVAALHAQGIVHRDIKPSNIFLSWSGRGAIHVTLVDLGVARVESTTQLTRDGMMIGTPSYMSPEQILGKQNVDAASDVFSLGVVLFELVARERPYHADDVVGLVAKIALQDPPRLSSIAPEVPPELEMIVATAMAKDPSSRFASALDLARALEVAPPYAVDRAAKVADDAITKASGPSSLATTERRIVTTVFVRLASTVGSHGAWSTFARIASNAGGVAHKLLSLAFVAVFGEERSAGDEAQRAARAALAIRSALPFASVAVATGRVLAGASGLAGEAIDRGVGLAVAAGGIRLDSATARMLGDGFEIVDDGGPVLAGERIAAGPSRTFLGREIPCVGRDRELTQLLALFDESAAESVARAAVVIGEPGVGKSRLRHELQARISHHEREVRFLVARGNAIAVGSPFGMIGAAIRAFANIQEDEPVAEQRAKLGLTVRTRDRSAIIPLVARLAFIDGAPMRGAEDGAYVSDQLRIAFEDWLRELSGEKPLCVVLEDAHHGDAPSMKLLDGALGNLTNSPIFVVALARPELDARFPRLWNARDPIVLRLGKLGRRASAELARTALGGRATQELVDSLVDRAGGNPFYLEELLRAVMSRSGAPSSVSDLPETVLGMVQARLDALGPSAKRILRAASVFGEAFWPGAIAAALDDAGEDTTSSLRDLVAREVVERRATSRFQGEEELAFRHGLLRDAAYEMLTDDDRREGHGRAAEWLESRGEREAALLARHYERAGQTARATIHYERAAEQALVGSDFEGAIECAELALAYGATAGARGRLLLTIAEARRWRGELEMALDSAAYAEEGLDPGTVEWFSAVREQIAATGRLGRRDQIAALSEKAASQAAQPGAQGAQIAALVPAAVHLLYAGEKSAAEALSARIETLTSRMLGLEPRARARVHQLRAVFAQARDEVDVAIREQEAALAQFRAANDKRAGALVSANLGFALVQMGAYERAEEVLVDALAVAETLGLGTIAPLAEQNLGALHARNGRLAEALATQTRAAERFAALRDPRLEATSRVHCALILLARGELDRAEQMVQPVMEAGFEPLRVGACAALAGVQLRRGDPRGALALASQAASVLGRLGSVEEFEMVARLTLVEASIACGQRDQARAAAAAARARMEEKAARVANLDLRRSFLERTPEHARLAELERALATH